MLAASPKDGLPLCRERSIATPSKIGELCRFAESIRYDALPAEVVEAVKLALLDAFACAFAASGCPPESIAERAFGKQFGGEANCSVIGRPKAYPLESAALLNGILVRYLDWMDGFGAFDHGDFCHPIENIPIALASCESAAASGRTLIEAILVGYETQLRLADAFSFTFRELHHASSAAFVAPLIAAKARGGSFDQTANAVALSGFRNVTLRSLAVGHKSMAKAIAVPLAGLNGILALRLAEEGFTGPRNALDWVFEKLAGPPPRELDLDPNRFYSLQVTRRRYPVQAFIQAPVEAAIELSRVARGDKIERGVVEIRTEVAARLEPHRRLMPPTRRART